MKILAGVLALLIVLIQYPLWLGRGGWLHVWQVDRQLAAQQDLNARYEARNAALAAEVVDLQHGYAAIEALARYQLGMIKPGEIFYQIAKRPAPTE